METKPPRARILIVDDEPDNMTILGEVLRTHYTVLVATTGQTAVSIASSSYPPDLILLDIGMPTMNGYDVLKALKANERTRNIKIVFVTAKDAIAEKMTAYQKGIEDYITKPIDPDFVLQIVSRLIKNQSESIR
jgi:putative two-component system response regulator